jgi:predicted acylesterase/phospholipase RssA
MGVVSRVGLVLGAGGAVGGAFHAAVLAALADELG